MPFCEECGNEIKDVAKFCPNCGTKTEGDDEISVLKDHLARASREQKEEDQVYTKTGNSNSKKPSPSTSAGAWPFALTVLAVGIVLLVIGAFFITRSVAGDSLGWLYVLGLGIGALGTLVLLIWALGMFIWSIDATNATWRGRR
tara:strand:- start:69 stop:500 length:432 start_codon:yes stop_codon:yes gene_type:complete